MDGAGACMVVHSATAVRHVCMLKRGTAQSIVIE